MSLEILIMSLADGAAWEAENPENPGPIRVLKVGDIVVVKDARGTAFEEGEIRTIELVDQFGYINVTGYDPRKNSRGEGSWMPERFELLNPNNEAPIVAGDLVRAVPGCGKSDVDSDFDLDENATFTVSKIVAGAVRLEGGSHGYKASRFYKLVDHHIIETFHPLDDEDTEDYDLMAQSIRDSLAVPELDHPPVFTSDSKAGLKFDDGAAPVFQGLFDYFPRACSEVSILSGLGAVKYEWKGWESVADAQNRYRNALGRHLLKRGIEGEFDSDWWKNYSKEVRHDTAVAWNALAVLEMRLREIEND